ncbi:MAG: VanW family protein [Clostridia bacterium]|nr:VanW family protein [Clostridia bacterium]
MLKRLTGLMLALLILFTCVPALAESGDDLDGIGEDTGSEYDEAEEDIGTLTDEELAALADLDEINEADEEPQFVVGETWHEMELSEVTSSTPVLYTCKIIKTDAGTPIYSERVADASAPEAKSKVLTRVSGDQRAEVLFVGANWCIVRYKKTLGYIKREKLTNVTPVDPVNTPPYGVQKSTYICETASECHVRKSMSDEDDCWVVLNPGTMLSIWRIQDGWAVVPYWRTYGYIRMEELTDLIPVSPTDTPIRDDTPIAAYTSYYSMSTAETNLNRLVNIDVACQRLTRVMQPGERFDFNRMVGPYNASTGYKQAPVLSGGTTGLGYGGGTCQVSSTLYNALMQCPGVTILYRRPHGPSGAKYLPHGVDAAVGNSSLNLRFRNDYDFPIRIEGHTSYDGALLMVVYRADTMMGQGE